MNSSQFLAQLQSSASVFRMKQLRSQLAAEKHSAAANNSPGYEADFLSSENAHAMIRLKEAESAGEKELNESEISSVRTLLEEYMDRFAPGQKKFKNYIVLISLYLHFIEEKPFHPEGMRAEGGRRLFFDGAYYRCPLKDIYSGEEKSLCTLCRAAGYSEMNNKRSSN